ncbi:hypothetical protein [Desulfovibrio cuneatus]|uniref:hypothetical protein n=1 Tax=Desulfovibrio cuneatus TaxID=159728 RepID=UPI00040BCEE2|nr:hypothetical protein [Desulfovibrio cuneatus]
MNTPAERPILFSAPMVQAIMAGIKTQTRRVITKKTVSCTVDVDTQEVKQSHGPKCKGGSDCGCPASPYGKVGELLWVRETWATSQYCDKKKPSMLETPGNGYGWPVWYAADNSVWWRGASKGGPAFTTRGKWRPSIFMPRWGSRITLAIASVRVERLHSITEEDAMAEGVERATLPSGNTVYRNYMVENNNSGPVVMPTIICRTAVDSYQTLWQKLHGPGAWEANPWVWAVTFTVSAMQCCKKE